MALGLANLTGRLRQAPDELVRINLFPNDFATLSDRGIRLFAYYTRAEAMKLMVPQGFWPAAIQSSSSLRSAQCGPYLWRQ